MEFNRENSLSWRPDDASRPRITIISGNLCCSLNQKLSHSYYSEENFLVAELFVICWLPFYLLRGYDKHLVKFKTGFCIPEFIPMFSHPLQIPL